MVTELKPIFTILSGSLSPYLSIWDSMTSLIRRSTIRLANAGCLLLES